ncbi:unnamed protein product [Pleuronectes platessa]|uniref:Uncharacterized protein n=1 Tax=Pleuronectes platessa TaxID=8262 RepID=A0A9N7TY35_PLEPL|nr:unnamed protein product [Pleuronectes platessa]
MVDHLPLGDETFLYYTGSLGSDYNCLCRHANGGVSPGIMRMTSVTPQALDPPSAPAQSPHRQPRGTLSARAPIAGAAEAVGAPALHLEERVRKACWTSCSHRTPLAPH